MIKKKHRKQQKQQKFKKKKPVRGLPADLKRKVKKIQNLRDIFDFKYPLGSQETDEENPSRGKGHVPNTGPGTAPNTGPGTGPNTGPGTMPY